MNIVWVQFSEKRKQSLGMYSGAKQSSCFYAYFAAGSLQPLKISAAPVHRELFEAHSSICESKSYCLKKTKTKVGRVYIFAPLDP